MHDALASASVGRPLFWVSLKLRLEGRLHACTQTQQRQSIAHPFLSQHVSAMACDEPAGCAVLYWPGALASLSTTPYPGSHAVVS